MCGKEISKDRAVFCPECISMRRAEYFKTLRVTNKTKCEFCSKALPTPRTRYCSDICSKSSRMILGKRHCKICFKYSTIGIKPLCKGDCLRIYNRLMQQVSRSRRYGK
jgi:predicted nucleic acid-binding Zn ribbon protein